MIFLRAVLCCILVLMPPLLRGDESLRRAQEELRKRNLYFGDVDGRQTPEINGAIRRYQERKGFPPTGELSPDTLRSLDIAPGGKGGEQWPEGVVMKSDAARQIAESDRKALEEMTTTLPAPPLEPAAPVPPPEPVAAGPDPKVEVVEETKAFVRDYLAACATNRLEAEMGFYADRMSYFDHGTVSREFVAHDVQRFYRRWPQREYELLDFRLTKVRGEEREVIFKIAFRYRNSEQSVSGRSSNVFKLRQEADGLRFISLKEQRIRE